MKEQLALTFIQNIEALGFSISEMVNYLEKRGGKMIELKNVSKKYGGRKALDEMTFNIPQGKIIGLVGENGSGKTTLLKLRRGLSNAEQQEKHYMAGVRLHGELPRKLRICQTRIFSTPILQSSSYSIFMIRSLKISI